MTDNKKGIIAIAVIVVIIIGLIVGIVCISGKKPTSDDSSQSGSGGTEFVDDNYVNAGDLFGDNKDSETDGNDASENTSENDNNNNNSNDNSGHMTGEEVDTSPGWGGFN